MKEKVAVSKRLSENIAQMEEFFHECDDIKKKELMLGRQMDVACYLTYCFVRIHTNLIFGSFLYGIDRKSTRLNSSHAT